MRRVAAIAVAALAVATLGGCRSGHVPASAAGPAIQSADCSAWRVLSTDGRTSLLDDLDQFFGAPVDGNAISGGRGPVLSSQRATALFDNYCGQPFAGAFKLYKLYGRAAAFTPVSQ